MVQQRKSAARGEANGIQDESEVLVGIGDDHAMTFEIKDISSLTVDGLDLGARDKLQNGKFLGQF